MSAALAPAAARRLPSLNGRIWVAPWPVWLLALGLALLSSLLVLQLDRAQQREVFETQARIAHRLLSQQSVQHEAVLATLLLTWPETQDAAGEARAAQRLAALFPSLPRLARRAGGQDWPDAFARADSGDPAALREAELRSRQSGRAEAVRPTAHEFSVGKVRIVQADGAAALALQIDLKAMLPHADWVDQIGQPSRPLYMQLRVDGPGANGGPEPVSWSLPRASGMAEVAHGERRAGRGWDFHFTKHLAAASQPFELQVQWTSGWAAWPWSALLASLVLSPALVLAGWRLWTGWRSQAEQRRRAEERLRFGQVARLNALGELAAGMAHELNQPLTAVLASSQAAARLLDAEAEESEAEERGAARAAARQALQAAVAQARRASEVLQRLRGVVAAPQVQAAGGEDGGTGAGSGSVATGAAPAAAEPGPLPLAQAVSQALDLLADESAALGLMPQLALPAGLRVAADPVALEQILHNLLSNAMQALAQVAPAERALRIEARALGGAQVELRIIDQGPGVPEALRARLFEPFVSGREGGLGLGLSLCETLAQSLGGALRHEPAPARGAVFVLTLPAA